MVRDCKTPTLLKATITYFNLGRQLVTPGDIAIYGTLCALACLPRSAIRTSLLENSTFGVYIEQEPHIREMIDAYMSSKFKTVLELLERYSVNQKYYASSRTNFLFI